MFASTHLLALLSLFYTLGLVFVLLGYSRTSAFIASRRDYILAYIVVYLIVCVLPIWSSSSSHFGFPVAYCSLDRVVVAEGSPIGHSVGCWLRQLTH